ncbi:uncharacterized protein LOC135487273 [Lineus longissimus]|uniref:uncharacterized protein LOC135487273 n=1 Tax=Lineus longissimus TaxID=88925 RepID=UPI00315CEEEB
MTIPVTTRPSISNQGPRMQTATISRAPTSTLRPGITTALIHSSVSAKRPRMPTATISRAPTSTLRPGITTALIHSSVSAKRPRMPTATRPEAPASTSAADIIEATSDDGADESAFTQGNQSPHCDSNGDGEASFSSSHHSEEDASATPATARRSVPYSKVLQLEEKKLKLEMDKIKQEREKLREERRLIMLQKEVMVLKKRKLEMEIEQLSQ